MDIIHKYFLPLKSFWMLWFGQSISQLGSAMTGFAVSVWAYEKTGSALVLSLASMSVMVPKIIVGVLAGPLVDRLNKKTVMLIADMGAGFCTLALLLLLWQDNLMIGHIYAINLINSVLSSFQSPASNVAISAMVPKEHYLKIGGLQSFSGGAVQMLSPVLAAALLGIVGMFGVMLVDFITMTFACITLVVGVKIPDYHREAAPAFKLKRYVSELAEGFEAVKQSDLLRRLMAFILFIDFIAGITYFTLITPMILARTANDAQALSLVNGALGLGGMVGALLVFWIPAGKRKIKMMFFCCALSFLSGDVVLSLTHSLPLWVAAGFATNLFLPFFSAIDGYFWRTIIPLELQGRAFSLKYAFQSGIIPVGMLVGGLLADYVFEPLMINSGKGEGMALMFLITGVLGTVYCVFGMFSPAMQKAEEAAEAGAILREGK